MASLGRGSAPTGYWTTIFKPKTASELVRDPVTSAQATKLSAWRVTPVRLVRISLASLLASARVVE